jgi:hypothetical protein
MLKIKVQSPRTIEAPMIVLTLVIVAMYAFAIAIGMSWGVRL